MTENVSVAATTLFTNARLFDVFCGECPEGMQVLIEGGLIRDVSDRPIKMSDAQVIDVGARTLVRGLIEAHFAPEFSEEMHELIPGSDLRIFEDSAHGIAVDEPQQFLDAVAGFVVYKSRSNLQ